jgi:probable HAF family extracellular repeat protein
MLTTPAWTIRRGALALLATLALATAAGAAPAPTTYRIIQLSAFAGNADINAKGQVAFTEVIRGEGRAMFYDGRVLEDIGTLGGATASVVAINDAGQIAGTSSTQTEGVFHAFRWSRATGMIDLAGPGTGSSFAADINSKGWVTGTAAFPTSPGHAFRWTPTTGMVDLGSLRLFSNGLALNDAGTVVGDSESVEGGIGQNPVRWPGTTPIPLATIATPFSLASDINNAGLIVGNGSIATIFEEVPFLWSPVTGFTDLGVRSSRLVTADQINEKGMVIGNTFSPGDARGFVWTRETGPIVFGTIEVDFSNTADLNNRGQVVGSFNGRAYVWTRAEGIVDLNTRLANAPPDLVLGQALAISDNGSIVATGSTGLVLLVPNAGGRHEAPVAGPIKMSGTPRVNALLSFHAAFRDADLRDTHKASWDWGDGSSSVGTVSEKNGSGSVSGQHAWRKAGSYTVKLTITDSSGRRTTVRRTVVVCGSGAAIVGEGVFLSPAAAYKAAPARASLASFSFASDTRGSSLAPVRFNVGALAFRSSRVESVKLERGGIEYRGSGTVNGAGNYRFVMNAAPGAKPGSADQFRIRISHTEPGTQAEVVDYDNQAAGSLAAGASIVVESE